MVIEPPAEEVKQAPQTEADTEAEQLSKEDKGERPASAEDPRKQEPHCRPDSGHLHHDEGQTAGEKVEEEPEKPGEEQETSHDKHQGGQEEEDQERQEMGQEGEQTAQSGEDLVQGGEGMSQEAAELPIGDLALGSGESTHRESEGGEGKGKHSPPGGDPLEDSLVYTATPRTLFEEKEEPLVKAHPLQKGVGMTGPLVDAEGFPRGDIDVYQVRNARHNVACLQNDHKEIMQQIEEALYRLHAYEREKREKDETQGKAEALEQDLPLPHPFAKVDTVTQGSPASMSGLQVGDEIFEFGTVNSLNFQNLQNIASVVQHSEGLQHSPTAEINASEASKP
ncbi:UNVERIFIED_CONTAM: hypothetical protein FKN15_058642 [Acipenser sinensis]